MIEILHNPHCSKSRCALGYLKENHLDFELRDYQKEPLNKEELREICKLLGLRPEEVVRKQESIFKENFAGREYTDEEWLDILAQNPKLLKRPIVIKNGKAVIARPLEKLEQLLNE